MKKSSKLVSVIIPTYKRPDTLPRSIDSVLRQTYTNIEIIVVDYNNPNRKGRMETEKVMKRFEDSANIIYLKHAKNKNGAAARNTGIRHSKGDYVAFLDDDDQFLPDKIEEQVNSLENLDDSWGACYTRYIRMDGIKKVSTSTDKREGNLLKEELMRNLFIAAGSNLMVRKSVIDEIKGFDESFKRNQDVEFLVKILTKYKLAFVDIIGVVIHVHKTHHKKVDVNDLTGQFINTFRKNIENFPASDQKDIFQMLNLQVYRYYLSTKQYSSAIKLIVSGKISITNSIIYVFHLLKRKLRKESKPYTLR